MTRSISLSFVSVAAAVSLHLPVTVFADDLTPAESRVVFDQPAKVFTESSPLGNGRLGAMDFGGTTDEEIALNETGMWSGSTVPSDRPNAFDALPEIRRLILEGKNLQAEKLATEKFTCLPEVSQTTGSDAVTGKAPGKGSITPFGCYQMLGDLRLKFDVPPGQTPIGYHRELDLNTAESRTEFMSGGVKFKREVFVSAPDQVVVIRLFADRPGSLSFTATFDRIERAKTVPAGTDALLMTGRLSDGHGGENVSFAARVQAVAKGGKVSTAGNALKVENADEVLLLVAGVTDIKTFSGRRADDPAATVAEDLRKASAKPFAELRRAHLADYQPIFRRASLHLGAADAAALAGTTGQRLQALAAGGNDPALGALLFNFGRYFLISAARPGGLPPNLQGLWSNEIQTAWNGDWHNDINLQMAHWTSEVGNLADLNEPLFKLVESLQKPGAETAKVYYHAPGWIVHSITNPWGFTSPGWNAGWATYVGAGAWLSQHLWDHYLFNPSDRKYLEWAYPILKGSAEFYSSMLWEYPENRWLVTGPSSSPENSFIDAEGKHAGVCAGPTMDIQQIRYLFKGVVEASKILGRDEAFREKLQAQLDRLPPTRVNYFGGVMEWVNDPKEAVPQHRHMSPLWGLYPGNEITPARTPELAKAAVVTLNRRELGDNKVGSWAFAWKIIFWSRLGDAEHAYKKLLDSLHPLPPDAIRVNIGGGSYPNMMNGYPPYQFDGNGGAPAGVAEMLLQSHEGDIHLLPTLPKAWPEGAVHGFRARGGFETDFAWKDGKLVSAVVRGAPHVTCKVHYHDTTETFTMPESGELHLSGDLTQVEE